MGDDITDTIKLPNFRLSKNIKTRTDIFYDEIGVKDIGGFIINSPLQKYAYGFVSTNLEFVNNDMIYENKLINIERYLGIVDSYFNSFLNFMWFAKDNSISLDFSYIKSQNKETRPLHILSYHYLNTYTCHGQHSESTFSKMEIEFAYKIFDAANKILPNKQRNKNQNKNIEDIENPLLSFTNSEIEYHSYGRLEKALLFLWDSRSTYDLLPKITLYCSVFECLFSTEKTDITYKISQRVALYIGNDFEERVYLKKLVTKAYNIRSRYIHGNALSKDDMKSDFKKEKLQEVAAKIDNVLRIILIKIILCDHEIFDNDTKLYPFFDELIFK